MLSIPNKKQYENNVDKNSVDKNIVFLKTCLTSVQLVEKKLQFQYSCGNLHPSVLHLGTHLVADGQWHDISLEVRGTNLRLTMDHIHSISRDLQEPCRLTQSHGVLLLANANPNANSPGFKGCLERLYFNGQTVRTDEGSLRNRLFGKHQCCKDEICASNPCENGGTCQEKFNRGKDKSQYMNANIV